ncbi:AcvB/VirJ family lysyl-phosphatidylglycerol hydrolase [Sphingomonas floccifaciens]|uniref:AcvB/VirJ family lysyl-phosphatidylglycerol hydrolase n=1 Tax=Sphingomonas floccifaciens TaxID=1844115 RepID=A0ABW4NBM6_9SPHN
MTRGRSRYRRTAAVVGAVTLLLTTLVACVPAFLSGSRYQAIPATGAFHGTAALFVSGDAGLRFGMGKPVVRALAAQGIPVVGINSPSAFGVTRTREQVDAVLADGIRRALATPGTQRLLLIGQSFGADMLSVAAPDLPVDLRRHVAAVVLVVPARTAYFRSDPLGLAYHRAPDARPAAGMRTLDWAPVVCIQGAAESDSLCPLVSGPRVASIALPGGHFLNHDDARLIGTILSQLARLGIA